MNFQRKPTKEGIQQWMLVKSKADVVQWHKDHTPWMNEDQINQILEHYDKTLLEKNLMKEQLLNINSQFQKLLLNM